MKRHYQSVASVVCFLCHLVLGLIQGVSANPNAGISGNIAEHILRVEAYAGPDDIICPGERYSLSHAVASNYDWIEWRTDGDGYFIAPGLINPVYVPGPSDIIHGQVELCIKAIVQAGVHMTIVQDCMTLFIETDPASCCCPEFVLTDALTICVDPLMSCFGRGYEGKHDSLMAACKNSVHTYTVYPNILGYSYVWTVTGGTPVSASGNPVSIHWGSNSEGTIVVEISGEGCHDRIVREICLIDGPQADFTFSPNPVCTGAAVQFINTSIGGSTYAWDFGDGTTYTGSNQPPPTKVYNTPGTYVITLTAIDEGYVNPEQNPEIKPEPCGCVDTITKTIEVIEAQGPDIITDCCYGSVCPGDTSRFSTTAVCSSYIWTVTPPGAGTILSGQNTAAIVVQWSTSYQGIQPVVSLSTPNCSTPACNIATSVVVPVFYPNLAIQGPSTVCQGSSASYSLPVLPGTHYTWTVSLSGVPILDAFNIKDRNVSTVNVSFGGPGTYTISCAYVNPLLGCSPGLSTFQVQVLPIFSFMGLETACEGSVVSYTVTGGHPAQWSVAPTAGVGLPAGASNLKNISWNNPGLYHLTASPVNASAFCNISDTKVVEVLKKPVLDNIVGDNMACPGEYQTYAVTSDTQGSPFYWVVSPPGSVIESQMGVDNDSIVVNFNGNGPWQISVHQELTAGCHSDPVTMAINAYGAPVITPQTSSVCAGETIIYTVNGPVPPGGITWSVSPPGIGTIIDTPNGNQAEILMHGIIGHQPPFPAVVTASHCGGSATAQITIHAPSDPILSYSETPVFCEGDNAILDLNLTYNCPGAQIRWYLSVNGGSPFVLSGVIGSHWALGINGLPGVGVYTYYAEVDCNGCIQKSNPVAVQVLKCDGPSPPNGGCGVAAMFVPYVNCDKAEIIDFSTALPGSSIVSYQYTVISGPGNATFSPSSQVSEPIITFDQSGQYCLELTIISSRGCSSKYNTCFNILLPDAEIISSAPACDGVPVSFAANPSNADFYYLWDFGDGFTAYQENTQHAYEATGGATTYYTASLEIIDSRGCRATATEQIAVYPAPVPAVLTEEWFCPGGFATLEANQAYGYQWYLDNDPIAGATGQTYNAWQHGYYMVETANQFGCTSFSNAAYVFMHPEPVASISGPEKVCAPVNSQAPFQLSTPNNSNYLYYWNGPSGNPSDYNFSPNNQSASVWAWVTVQQEGPQIFSVTVVDQTTGCVKVDFICVYFYFQPDMSGTVLYACEGSNHDIGFEPTNTSLYSYQWSHGPTTPRVMVSAPGEYWQTITNLASGCSASAMVANIQPKPDLRLFPLGCRTIACDQILELKLPLPLNALPNYPIDVANTYTNIVWHVLNLQTQVTTDYPGTEVFPFSSAEIGEYEVSVTVTNYLGCIEEAGKFCIKVICQGCPHVEDPAYTKILQNKTISQDRIWDGKVYLGRGVIVTVENRALLDITNVDVVFDKHAGIIIKDGAHLRANNSVFRSCEMHETWMGIRFEASPYLSNSDGAPSQVINVINECTFKNAEIALYFKMRADALISNNLFSNCNHGIRVEANFNFNHPISGNQFVTESFFPDYSQSIYTFINNQSTYGIYASMAKFLWPVSQNRFVKAHPFSGGNVHNINQSLTTHGIHMHGSGGNISRNTFSDLQHAVFLYDMMWPTLVQDNEIEVKSKGHAPIWIESYGPIIEIHKNTIISKYNRTGLNNTGIYARNSANLSMSANYIDGFNTGIYGYHVINSQATKNIIEQCHNYGIYFHVEPGGYDKSFITCNEIRMKNFSGIGIALWNASQQTQVTGNCVFDSRIAMRFHKTSNASPVLPIIRNNFLYNYSHGGISIIGQNYSGNLGVLAGDPGMNTFWSNRSGVADIQKSHLPAVYQSGNFGVSAVSANVISIGRERYHSTASCAHQIFGTTNQQKLNTNWGCIHNDLLFSPEIIIVDENQLAPGLLKHLEVSENPENDLAVVLSTANNLSESELEFLMSLTALEETAKARLRYGLHLRQGNYGHARNALTATGTANMEDYWYRQLRMMHLDALEQGWEMVYEQQLLMLRNYVESFRDIPEQATELNFAIFMLNNSQTYREYLGLTPEKLEIVEAEGMLSLEEVESFLHIRPNPASTSVFITAHNAHADESILQVFDVNGREAIHYDMRFVTGGIEMDISKLRQGVYFVILSDKASGYLQKGKLIKIN